MNWIRREWLEAKKDYDNLPNWAKNILS